MAEVDLIDSIATIAGAGIKLSITLYTFSETVAVAVAPSAIRDIAHDVSLTSSVLEELGANLKQDDQATLYSGAAVQTVKDAAAECETVFKDVDGMVARAMESAAKSGVKKEGKLVLSAQDQLEWPFTEARVVILKGNLDRLKSTLVLMLHVSKYARNMRAEKNTPSQDDNDGYQKTLLENLLRANEEATRNYQRLKTMGTEGETATRAPLVTSELELNIRGCFKRIESALLQVEQAGPLPGHSPRAGVRIEMEKDFGQPRNTLGRPNPWVVLSIIRKDQRLPGHARTPSNPEADDLDMYASVAAGAIESIGIEDEAPRYQNRAQPRIDGGISRRSETLPVLGSESRPRDLSIGVQRRSGRKPWYSSVWESLPSPTAALGSIQETVKNSGLFFGVDEETENPDTVLQYNKPGGGGANQSPAADPAGPKIARSPTFDDMLKAPSVKGRTTPALPHTIPPASPNPDLASTNGSDTIPAPPKTAAKEEPVKQELPDLPATVARADESSKEPADSAVEDPVGKQELVEQGKPDQVDQLLKQWTTLYDDQ